MTVIPVTYGSTFEATLDFPTVDLTVYDVRILPHPKTLPALLTGLTATVTQANPGRVLLKMSDENVETYLTDRALFYVQVEPTAGGDAISVGPIALYRI